MRGGKGEWRPKWQPIAELDYVQKARERTSVIWWGGKENLGIFVGSNQLTLTKPRLPEGDAVNLFHVLEIRARACQIASYEEWDAFAGTCHTVWYKDGKQWSDNKAQNYQLTELAADTAKDSKFIRERDRNGNPREFPNEPIVTAFDSRANKRLIVDGIHRGAIMTNESKNRLRIPNATIMECFGKKVNQIFPFDFSHL